MVSTPRYRYASRLPYVVGPLEHHLYGSQLCVPVHALWHYVGIEPVRAAGMDDRVPHPPEFLVRDRGCSTDMARVSTGSDAILGIMRRRSGGELMT